MTEYVKTEVAAGIMTLTLARPDKKNALSNAMYSAMSDGLERAEQDRALCFASVCRPGKRARRSLHLPSVASPIFRRSRDKSRSSR
jgi:hypothetical protein